MDLPRKRTGRVHSEDKTGVRVLTGNERMGEKGGADEREVLTGD